MSDELKHAEIGTPGNSAVGAIPPGQPSALQTGYLVEGKRDPFLGKWVVDLIYQEGRLEDDGKPLFVVYLDEEFSVQWYFQARDVSGITGPCGSDYFPAGFNLILNDMVHLETLSQSLRRPRMTRRNPLAWGRARKEYEQGLDLGNETKDFSKMKARQSQLRATRRLAAEALARTYEKLIPPSPRPAGYEDPRMTAAKAAIGMAQSYMKARSSDVGRSYLLIGAAVMTILSLATVLVLTSQYSQNRDGVRDRLRRDLQNDMSRAVAIPPAEFVEMRIDPKGNTVISGLRIDPEGEDKLKVEEVTGAVREFIKSKQAGGIEKPDWLTRQGWELSCFTLTGAFGAMLSMLMSASKREYDSGAGRPIYILEGASRIMIGLLGAFFITLAIKGNLLLGFAADNASSADGTSTRLMWIHYVFGFVAGVSEQFVPSFIKVVEAQAQSTTQETKK